MESKKLFLLDAYGLIYRAYYALMRSPRITTKGLNTSAIFGFCNTIDDVLRNEEPTHIAVCFDPHGPTFRHEVYPQYKEGRQKQPEDITIALPYIKQILDAYNIKWFEVPGYEADDVIGTLSTRASKEGFVTYMMTLDKDYGQLVRDNVCWYRPALKGQGFDVRWPKETAEFFGIDSPDHVVDYLALEGDKSDNVPGCPGIGEKTASALVMQWGTVENMIEHAAEIKGANGKRIAENAEQIKFSKYLVTIATDAPIDIDLESLKRQEPDYNKLIELYNELEFRTFLSRLHARAVLQGNHTTVPAPPTVEGMDSLFDFADAPTDDEPEEEEKTCDIPQGKAAADYAVIDTPAEIAKMVKEAVEQDIVGVSCMVVGDEAMTATLYGMGFSYGDKNVYIPLPESHFDRQELFIALEPLFAEGKHTIACQDIKRCTILIRREGVDFQAKYFDTAVAHYLLKPEAKHYADFIAFDMLGYRTLSYDLTDPIRKKLTKAKLSDAPARATETARVQVMLVQPLKDEISKQGMQKLLDEVEMPLVEVLASMEWEGARIDVGELAKMSVALSARLQTLEEECYQLAGRKFNIGSPAQVGDILFGEMKIDPNAKTTKSGAWSTTEEILEKHRKEYPIVDKILQARALKKLLATYVDALPTLVNPITGKLHTTYQQTVTATGRISSTNPNLQNIPIRTDDGREIRRAFIPDPGDIMLSADYSQIELRLMADFSGDPTMVKAFNDGEDIHRSTAAKIYHVALDEVTDNQRRNAKTANFGIIYGISAFGLSERLEIPRKEAKMLIDGYLETYPGVKKYMEESIEKAREQGYVSTIMGRKRYLPDINSRNATVRGYAERNAINAPLQGSAADIIKLAMVRIHREFIDAGLRSRMILQVHDELIFNVKEEELARVQEIVTRCMTHAYKGKVALEVSSGYANNWLEAH